MLFTVLIGESILWQLLNVKSMKTTAMNMENTVGTLRLYMMGDFTILIEVIVMIMDQYKQRKTPKILKFIKPEKQYLA